MLVLCRKAGETLCIGDDILVTVTEIKGHRVRLAIDAAPDTRVLRSELMSDAGERFERACLSQGGGSTR